MRQFKTNKILSKRQINTEVRNKSPILGSSLTKFKYYNWQKVAEFDTVIETDPN